MQRLSIKMRKYAILLVLVFCTLVYFFSSLSINQTLYQNSGTPYYGLLLKAFLDGQLHVNSDPSYDLTSFKSKQYLYWGPAATLFILPFHYLLGDKNTDLIYTLSAGMFNILIFFLIILEVMKFFKLKVSKMRIALLVISFALASPNFYLSLSGRIWHTSQIIAVFYLLLFLFTFFKFLNNQKKFFYLFLSLVFFNLSWLTRYLLIINGILYLLPLIIFFRQKIFFKILFQIILVNLVFLCLFFSYNYLRFNDILETGLRYQLANGRFADALRQGRGFSLTNIGNNFYYYFLNNPLVKNSEYIFDPEGLSVFIVYPLLFCLLFFFKLRINHKIEKLFILIAFAVIVINIFLLLTFLGTGWSQFGSRYFFDCIPLLFLLTLFLIRYVPIILLLAVTIYGVGINYLGAVYFFSHF